MGVDDSTKTRVIPVFQHIEKTENFFDILLEKALIKNNLPTITPSKIIEAKCKEEKVLQLKTYSTSKDVIYR